MSSLEQIRQLDKIDGNFDYLIICVGFEERSLGVLQRSRQAKFKKAFLLSYKNNPENPSDQENLRKAKQYLSRSEVQELTADSTNPIHTVAEIVGMVKQTGLEPPRVAIDISAMSKHVLLLLMKSLKLHDLLKYTTIFYTEPQRYVIDEDIPLSVGTKNIGVVPTFEGVHDPARDLLLILILGYEGDRSFAIWNKLEPEKCILVIADPPFQESWKGKTEKLNGPIVKAVGQSMIRYSSARDPIAVSKTLKNIVAEFQKERPMNCMIVPMGTKPQSLGAFYYYCESYSYPTLIYAEPKHHTQYSVGVGPTYELVSAYADDF